MKLSLYILISALFIYSTKSQAGEKKELIFNETIKEAKEFFTPYYLSKGKIFSIESDFDYHENNAKASAFSVDHYYIELYGGLIKQPRGTKDSLRAAICHEIGHHFGGRPFVPRYYEEYFFFRGSSEGQADYWSVHTCLRKWLHGEDHEKILRKNSFSFRDLNFCKSYYKKKNEYLLCTRIITAYKNMLKVDLNMPINLQVLKPIDSYIIPLAASVIHPKKSCRMETVYAGSICNSKTEYGCHFSGNRPEASRPLCWVGLEEILEFETPKLSKNNLTNLIKRLKKMNLKGFTYNFYEDDETRYLGKQLASKHEDIISKISSEFTHK
jgi:hypothetical protein